MGVWFWGDGFGCMALGVGFGFERMAFGRMFLGVWFWAYGFGRIVWTYGFGRIVWTYDFGGTPLQTRAGQAQKYIPILNRKISD